MSCKKCNEIQDKIFEEKLDLPIAYFRIDNANIAIIGCEAHIKETMDRLRK